MSLIRDVFGALKYSPELTAGRALIAIAIRTGKIPPEDKQMVKHNRGWVRNYDVYDVTAGGGKAIVQRRETTITKYGNNPQKSYFLIEKRGRGVVVTELVKEKPLIVRRAKQASKPGEVIHSLPNDKRSEIADAAVRAARAKGMVGGNVSNRREHARAI